MAQSLAMIRSFSRLRDRQERRSFGYRPYMKAFLAHGDGTGLWDLIRLGFGAQTGGIHFTFHDGQRPAFDLPVNAAQVFANYSQKQCVQT